MTNKEKAIALEQNKNNPMELVYLALVNGERWIEAEATIMNDAYCAYTYAIHVLRNRWKKAEATIMTDPHCAYIYASNVLRGPWLEAEETIMKNNLFWFLYKNRFDLRHRLSAPEKITPCVTA